MELLFRLCIYVSVGVITGFLFGGIKVKFTKKAYTEKQIELSKRIVNRIANALKFMTILFLSLGFIWCTYFLILGVVSPAQSDYANNMAELIVSVLTVISIIFAFAEFLRRTDNK